MTAPDPRSAVIAHLHADHGGYPAGHDFVLVSTADIIREHAWKFPGCLAMTSGSDD